MPVIKIHAVQITYLLEETACLLRLVPLSPLSINQIKLFQHASSFTVKPLAT